MNTAMVRLWSLQNVFFLWLASPKIVELSADRCVVRIPLNWRTRRRDIHAMYLGTLCMGADVAAGLIAFDLVARGKAKVSFIFKDMTARFLKRESEFGTIAVGQRADLLLLEANPLQDVANASRRVGVFVRGRWFAETDLQRRVRQH